MQIIALQMSSGHPGSLLASILIYPHHHPLLRLSRFYFQRAKPLELTHTTTWAPEQWVRSLVLHPSSCFIDMRFLVLEISIRCPDGWSWLTVASKEVSVPPFHSNTNFNNFLKIILHYSHTQICLLYFYVSAYLYFWFRFFCCCCCGKTPWTKKT